MSSTVSAGLLDSDLYAQNNEETFIIGFDPEFPPFGYKDNNGEYTGFDIELAKEVAKRNNWKFIAMPFVDWNTKDTELNGGMIDCIWSEFTINNRENDYTWSKEYFNNQQVFIVRSDSNISSIDDLKGKNVEIQGSSSILNALENDNKTIADSFKKISEINNYNTTFMDLKAGACDALIVDICSANYQINNSKNNNSYKISNEPLTMEKYGIAFKKDNTELRDKVQQTLDEMYADGTVDKIAQKYSEYGIPDRIIKQ